MRIGKEFAKSNQQRELFATGDDLMRGRPYLVIENNGDVRWIPPMVLKTVCEHDNQVWQITIKNSPTLSS